MKRVVVVGSPGAGKTTFSKKLSIKTELPLIHLDYYYHQKEFNYYERNSAWRKKVLKIMKPDRWIIDGNFSDTYHLRLPISDTILFLDYPRRVYIYGILKRWTMHKNKSRSDMPDDWREKVDLRFLKLVWGFDRNDRRVLLKELEKNKDKEIVIFKNRKQAEEYLKML